MVDRLFFNHRLAALYDLFYPRRADFEFYLPLVMSSKAVLDVGCGTGALLRTAREAGHTGRLCGLDPADGMLEQARKRSDIEWVLGNLSSVAWDREFDLIVMTGHAFQVFIDDREIHASLAAIRSALTDDGRFVFETRNPRFQAWKTWTPENAVQTMDETGAVVRMSHQLDLPIDGDIVSFTTTFTSPAWEQPELSRSRLRFLDSDSLSQFLTDACLRIDDQFGYWDRSPLTDTSPEIITIARRQR
jgi:ubiquinone/menaquinone biosynthesis C-methylase UbiE